MINKVRSLFDRGDQARCMVLLVLGIFGSILETVGVALIPLFITFLTNPEQVIRRVGELNLGLSLDGYSHADILLAGSAILAIFFIGKNLLLIGTVYMQNRFLADQQTKLFTRLLRQYLEEPYTFHLSRNSSELIRNFSQEVGGILYGVLLPGFMLFGEIVVVILVGGLLILVEPVASTLAVAAIGGVTLLFYTSVRRRLERLGVVRQFHLGEMIKWVSQGLGGVKEIRILGRESYFLDALRSHVGPFAEAQRQFQTLTQTPRLIVETVAFVGMMMVTIILVAVGRDLAGIVATLALFGIAAVRLMPSANRILVSANSIRFNAPSVDVLHREMVAGKRRSEQPVAKHLQFVSTIELRGVTYRYPDSDVLALEDVSLRIGRGTAVGFVGHSGAGKTTAVDIILGLFPPTAGEVLVDGVDIAGIEASWQRHIGYVPQAIYLSDDSIRRNIAFGVPDEEIVDEDVWDALTAAQMGQLVRSLPEGLDTMVGERGVRLSGGQRQRLGIARALYHRPEVLVMDEATAALDTQTEREIAAVFNGLRGTLTMILIAHRLSTVKKCDQLFLMHQGRLVHQGTYDELLQGSADFRTLVA